MKLVSKTLLPKISGEQFSNLTTLVDEKLDVEISTHRSKTFTTTDMWKIRKQRKSFGIRRFI